MIYDTLTNLKTAILLVSLSSTRCPTATSSNDVVFGSLIAVFARDKSSVNVLFNELELPLAKCQIIGNMALINSRVN